MITEGRSMYARARCYEVTDGCKRKKIEKSSNIAAQALVKAGHTCISDQESNRKADETINQTVENDHRLRSAQHRIDNLQENFEKQQADLTKVLSVVEGIPKMIKILGVLIGLFASNLSLFAGLKGLL